MGDVDHQEQLFQRLQRRTIRRKDREGSCSETPGASTVVSIQGAVRTSVTDTRTPSTDLVPVQISVSTVPEVGMRRLALANIEQVPFELEKAIAQLKHESDGCSRAIPRLNEILGTLRSCIPKLSE